LNQIWFDPLAGLVKVGELENANLARAGLGILRTNKVGVVSCLQVARLGLAVAVEIASLIIAFDTQQQQIGIVAIGLFFVFWRDGLRCGCAYQ